MKKYRKISLPTEWVAIRNRKTREVRFIPKRESK